MICRAVAARGTAQSAPLYGAAPDRSAISQPLRRLRRQLRRRKHVTSLRTQARIEERIHNLDRRWRTTRLKSCAAKSRYRSQLCVDDLDVTPAALLRSFTSVRREIIASHHIGLPGKAWC